MALCDTATSGPATGIEADVAAVGVERSEPREVGALAPGTGAAPRDDAEKALPEGQ